MKSIGEVSMLFRLHIMIWCLIVSGCGNNSLKQFEKEDAAEDAAIELENEDPDKAIEILDEAIADDPENWKLISMLSAAYAQKAEVDLLDLALNMAITSTDDTDSASTEDQTELAQLWEYLPPATDANLTNADTAVNLLRSIPQAERTQADHFKLALLSTASLSLRLKSFDLNGDGQLSAAELARIGLEDASAVLSGIAGAAEAIGYAGEQGENADVAAETIASIAAEIEDTPGDTDQEKIQNYFEQNQGSLPEDS